MSVLPDKKVFFFSLDAFYANIIWDLYYFRCDVFSEFPCTSLFILLLNKRITKEKEFVCHSIYFHENTFYSCKNVNGITIRDAGAM